MTKQKDNSSSHKKTAVVFLPIGMAFIAIGSSNSDLRLFILAGVGFLVSGLFSWRASRKKVNDVS